MPYKEDVIIFLLRSRLTLSDDIVIVPIISFNKQYDPGWLIIIGAVIEITDPHGFNAAIAVYTPLKSTVAVAVTDKLANIVHVC
jgi:hypothetical protein